VWNRRRCCWRRHHDGRPGRTTRGDRPQSRCRAGGHFSEHFALLRIDWAARSQHGENCRRREGLSQRFACGHHCLSKGYSSDPRRRGCAACGSCSRQADLQGTGGQLSRRRRGSVGRASRDCRIVKEVENTKPIIVIKKGVGHGGHHGGAWKVAYADFVTAMMALFIVLWLLNTSKPVREATAGYFKDPSGTAGKLGTTMEAKVRPSHL